MCLIEWLRELHLDFGPPVIDDNISLSLAEGGVTHNRSLETLWRTQHPWSIHFV